VKVLIIEDNEEVVEYLSLAIRIRWQYAEVLFTRLGKNGIELAKSKRPDIIILDIGLPDMGGFEVLKAIRLSSSVPIVILTVKGDEEDIVKGLEWGADDYITKPFRQSELLARLAVQLRKHILNEVEPQLTFGEAILDANTHQLHFKGKTIELTTIETQILGCLMKNQGCLVTSTALAEAVWGEEYPGVIESLRVHIRHLRSKVEANANRPEFILTKTRAGYYVKYDTR